MTPVEIDRLGTVTLIGGLTMVGQIAAGHLHADGNLALTSTGA